MSALPYVEGVDAVVTGLLVAAVVDAASRDDDDVRTVADIEIVIHRFGESRLAEQNGQMHALALGAGADDDVDAVRALLGTDLNVSGRGSAEALSVGADVVGACGDLVQVSDRRK